MTNVVERFMKYVAVHTTSDPTQMTTPSTQRQFDLAKILFSELRDLGVDQVTLDEHGYVFAKICSNTDKDVPAVGFVAHMDTSPDFNGENVKPQMIPNYDGGDIALGENIILSPQHFPSLLDHIGQTLITTDGTTLLGADDKAGVAEIMTAVAYILEHDEIKHGDICIGFTPDEEIGRGVVKFDVAKFGADFAYTVDGGEVGGIDYENFNAASLVVKIQGRMVHPGSAKDKMVNATELAMEFHQALPQYEKPEYTEGYEGFYHLQSMTGSVEESVLEYIIRDHDDSIFAKKKAYAQQVADQLQLKYPLAQVSVTVSDTYLNMRRQIEPQMHIVELAKTVMVDLGITPIVSPIRGGTDGSNLSYMGLPCPNLFTGGYNYHGRFEYIAVESMEKTVRVIVGIIAKLEQTS